MISIINKVRGIIYRILFSPLNYAKYIGVNIGEKCLISTKSFSSEPYLITIGNNVRIANKVSFFTHGGLWTFRKQYPDLDVFGKIKINDNTYIGEGCNILPGVEIGRNCVIGAGTVVSKSIPDNCIVVGNPCRIVGNIDNYLKKMNKKSVNSKNLTYQEKKSLLSSLSDDKFIIKKILEIE